MFKEAEIALKNKCTSSLYFLLYYSLFHGMLAALCFDPTITLEEITDIKHSKVGTRFKNTYCTGKNRIISDEIYNLFIEFKSLREYYSYTPPLNTTMYSSNHLDRIDSYLTQCFQLTSLHSLIFQQSFEKYSKISQEDFRSNIPYLKNSFYKLISKESLKSPKKYELDPADKNVLGEIIRDGISFFWITLQLDHTYDEFRLYGDSSSFYEDGIQSQSIYDYIYDKII